MPKRQLLLQAELVFNRLRREGMIERQRAAFDNSDRTATTGADQYLNRLAITPSFGKTLPFSLTSPAPLLKM